MFHQAAGMRIEDKPVMANYGDQDTDDFLK